ncbi:hypothetical protein HDV00_001473 [Rhizophlyctis rosea]|nr:hypothetical protein HDV00_001473 [Rhizophlyctis rosea]
MSDENITQKVHSILNMDLTSLQNRLKRLEPRAAARLVTEYKRFLAVKIQLNDTDAKFLSPSPLINECWHNHILDTRAYDAMFSCIGMKIHHDPDGGDDEVARDKRRKMTLNAYELYFKKKPPTDIWAMGGVKTAVVPEQTVKRKYEGGSKAVCIRPSLDSLRVAHRPAVYYVCVWFVQWLATIALKDLGVEERWIDVPNEGIQRVFYRPATVPDDERVGMPIIFVHGKVHATSPRKISAEMLTITLPLIITSFSLSMARVDPTEDRENMKITSDSDCLLCGHLLAQNANTAPKIVTFSGNIMIKTLIGR